jgi:hypothetical protein
MLETGFAVLVLVFDGRPELLEQINGHPHGWVAVYSVMLDGIYVRISLPGNAPKVPI